MANLLQHFTFALVLFALTTGFWNGVESSHKCYTVIEDADCENSGQNSCISRCRSGFYFKPWALIEFICQPARTDHGHVEYTCTCVWECNAAAAAAAAGAQPPVSVARAEPGKIVGGGSIVS